MISISESFTGVRSFDGRGVDSDLPPVIFSQSNSTYWSMVASRIEVIIALGNIGVTSIFHIVSVNNSDWIISKND